MIDPFLTFPNTLLTVVSTVWHAFCYVRNLTLFKARLALLVASVSRETFVLIHMAVSVLRTRLIVSRGTLLMKVKHIKTFGQLKNSPYLCIVKQKTFIQWKAEKNITNLRVRGKAVKRFTTARTNNSRLTV